MSGTERLIGRVKWFNNKTGFGFITVVGGKNENAKDATDVFVHHSAISVAQEQYRYLVQGEYVEFTLGPLANPTEGGHQFQATEVTGVKGGKLICETRYDTRKTRPVNERESQPQSSVHPASSSRVRGTTRVTRGAPRVNSARGGSRSGGYTEEWMLVRTRRPTQEPNMPSMDDNGVVRGVTRQRGRGTARVSGPRQSHVPKN